jgi:hypothetical protein
MRGFLLLDVGKLDSHDKELTGLEVRSLRTYKLYTYAGPVQVSHRNRQYLHTEVVAFFRHS